MSKSAAHPVVLLLVLVTAMAWASPANAQVELLPIDHPATQLLVRLYEYGLIPDFPREHLPIDRGTALGFLRTVSALPATPEGYRDLARYYSTEIMASVGLAERAALLPTDGYTTPLLSDPFGNRPFSAIDHLDSAAQIHVVLAPVFDGEVIGDPANAKLAVIGLLGAELRGTALGVLGFSARVTNGSIAGDLDLARRDSAVVRNGSFGVTAFGRDLGFGDGHLRLGFGADSGSGRVALEIGRERIQAGGGTGSLLLSSMLSTRYDYLRLSASFGRVSFSHIHASLLGEPTGDSHGPFAEIPQKYLATHLLSIGPIAGVRLSLGESVVYQGRGFEIGYLNPFVFIKSQEQYLLDRDNANMYAALSANPFNGLFLEGELLIDDLRYSLIGDGFWGNKTAWRISAKSIGAVVPWLDLALSYSRFEPYVFTHFNRLNNYVHNGSILSGGGQPPNSGMLATVIDLWPLPGLVARIRIGAGEYGANILRRDATTGADTLIFNAGGDVRQTHRQGIDSDVVEFLAGDLHRLLQVNLEAEYEMLRGVYLRIGVRRYSNQHSPEGIELITTDTELRIGMHIGAH